MKSLFAITALALSLGLTACVETTQQTCTDEKLEDVPGLEGTHLFSMLDGEFVMSTQTMKILRVGKGQYEGQGSIRGVARTCKVGSQYVVESQTKYGTYYMQALTPSSKGFSMSTFVVGVNELNANSVPYEIVERINDDNEQKRLARFGLARMDQSKSKVLVIDNSNAAAKQVIESSARPFGLGYIFQ